MAFCLSHWNIGYSNSFRISNFDFGSKFAATLAEHLKLIPPESSFYFGGSADARTGGESGALLSQGPDLERRGGGGRAFHDLSPAGREQQAVQDSGDPQQEHRGTCNLKPRMPEQGKDRDGQPRNDLSLTTLGMHGHPGGGRIGQFFHRVLLTVAEEDGLVRREDGSQAKQATLGGEQADEFLLALPQHGSGDLGMRAHHMMFDREAFVSP